MTGQIPMMGGRAVKVDDHRAVMFNEAPEAEAFRRWQAEEFFEIERRFAKTFGVPMGQTPSGETLDEAHGRHAEL